MMCTLFIEIMKVAKIIVFFLLYAFLVMSKLRKRKEIR